MRTNQNITQDEVKNYVAWCTKHNIIDDGSADSIHNGNVVKRYFTETWPMDLTSENLELAFPQLQSFLMFKSVGYLEVERLARTYFDSQNLADWFDNQNLLTKEGDEGFRNLAELIQELAAVGQPATEANITRAIQSIEYATNGGSLGKHSTRRRHPLIYASKKSQRKDSFHLQTDDGTNPFTVRGLTKQRDGSYGKSPADYAREARAAAQEPQQTPEEKLSAVDRDWKRLAEEARESGRSWREKDDLRKLFDDLVSQGLEWRRVCEGVDKLRNQFRRIREQGR